MPAGTLQEHELQAKTRNSVTEQAGTNPVTAIANATSITTARTVASGTDTSMYVMAHGEIASQTVTSITFGGVNLRRIARIQNATFGFIELWFLLAPAVSTANVVTTFSALGQHGHAIYVIDNNDQVEPLFPFMVGNGSAALSSLTAPQAASGRLILDGLGIDGTGHSNLAGANQTEDYDIEIGSGTHTMVGSVQQGSDGGVMSHSWTGSAPYVHLAFGLRPSVSVGGGAALTQDIDDSVTMSDAFFFTQSKVIAESVGLSDALGFDIAKVIAETVGLADSLAFQREMVVPDTVSVADSLTASLGREVVVNDNVGLADTPVLESGKGVTVDDSVSLSDSVAFQRTLTVADALALADAVNFGIGMTVAEALSLSDTLKFDRAIVLSDNPSISDDITPELTVDSGTAHTQTVDDFVSTSDSLSMTRGVVLNESVSLQDSNARALNGIFLTEGASPTTKKQNIVVIGRF